MSSLLEKDYNAINHQDFYDNRIVIELPHGKLGIELENKKYYTIIDIYKNSKLKDIVKIGDELFTLNNELLEGKTTEEVELLFLKNIISKRVLIINRPYC
tara:strand:+ start:14745 stop:15044 length:300 start_codon:yes stop_codon:yes gene_type:complete